jgi:hypothetical protein
LLISWLLPWSIRLCTVIFLMASISTVSIIYSVSEVASLVSVAQVQTVRTTGL